MLFPHVLDASVALIAEGYMTLPGMNWWSAMESASQIGEEPPPAGEEPVRTEKTEEQKVAENNAVLSNLMAGLGGSSFGGAG